MAWEELKIYARGVNMFGRFGTIFRGQASVKWPLISSFGRLATLGGLSKEQAAHAERELLREFQATAPLYLPTNVVLQKPPQTSCIWWWTLGQHHGLATRLLDWTRLAHVACYFAASGAWDEDGVVYECGKLSGHFDEPSLGVRKNAASDNGSVMMFDPPIRSDRMVAQQGLFSVASDPFADHSALISKGAKWILPAADKPKMLAVLREMNISAATLFPGLDGAARGESEKLICGRHRSWVS